MMQALQWVMPPGVLTGSQSWSLHMVQVSTSDRPASCVALLEAAAGFAGAEAAAVALAAACSAAAAAAL
jgi:hypothetical protein